MNAQSANPVVVTTRGSPGGGWLRNLWHRATSSASNLIYPPHCAFCGVEEEFSPDQPQLCQACRALIFPSIGPVCRRCAVAMPSGQPAGDNCPRCRDQRFHFENVTALGFYGDALRKAVLMMKNRQQAPLAIAVGKQIAIACQERFPDWRPDFVVPVPIHWSSRLWRGGNTLSPLAGAASRQLDAPLVEDLLISARKTKQQRTLSPPQRRSNVRGAFRVSTCYAINSARVLLVDDTLTTGATANEAAKVLRRAGATQVLVAVAARSVLHD